jgi:hypothetical protein
MTSWQVVTTAAELSAAVQSGAKAIEVQGEIRGMPMVTLGPGVRLRGGTLVFGAKGVCLTRDNVVEGVTIRCPDHEVAVLNDTGVSDLGTLTLRNVKTTGQVLLLARDAVKAGKVRVAGLTISSADLRGRVIRPRGFGVEALQGAFTLWNLQPDANVVITAELLDIAAGTAEQPARGSGVFVGGHGNVQGKGDGGQASFDSIATMGDGAVGVQVSKPLPLLEVRGDIRTSGGEGMSLVKGVQVRLKAIALSVKPGANVGAVRVGGQIETVGADVVSVEIDGKLDEIQVRGGIAARGPRSDAVHVRGDVPGLGAVAVTAANGKTVIKRGM